MTNDSWHNRSQLVAMLKFALRKTKSTRKVRLAGVAFCRRIPLTVDQRISNAILVAERLSDGLASRDEIESTLRMLTTARDRFGKAVFRQAKSEAPYRASDSERFRQLNALICLLDESVRRIVAVTETTQCLSSERSESAERKQQCKVV